MHRRLNIGLLTHSVRARGGVIHTLELAESLIELGHRVTVIASAEVGETLFRQVPFPVDVIRLPVLPGELVAQVALRIQTLVEELPALLEAGRFDVLHAQDSLSGNALALLKAAGHTLPPWVRTVHHLDQFSSPLLMQWQERAWRQADGVACVSDLWLRHFREQLQVRPERMYNGVRLSHFNPTPSADDARLLQCLGMQDNASPLCLLVGGVEQRKNSVRLLQAFMHNRRTLAPWAQAQLVVVGGASMLDHSQARQQWNQVMADAGWREGPSEPVWCLGTVADELMPALMRRAAVLGMPSLMEGFGLAAIEALACGTPVLVSQRAPFTEHLSTSPNVAWCDPEDVGSMAAGLAVALGYSKLTSPPQVCLEHSWSHSARLHERWYLSLQNAREAVPHPSLCLSH